jgi:hypothetical protein
MKRILFSTFFIGTVWLAFAQQISIPRIELMPNLPAPYLLRDWKQVAIDYDNFVFNTSKTGTYLPITNISTADGINYPALNTIRMDTYVGQSDHGNVAEAINILPAIVGASLVGIDKTTHLDINWVEKIKDFYNLENGQNVYLNSYSADTGEDWWYEVMPNVFFYQLYTLYPDVDTDFDTQFTTIADRELNVLYQLGGEIQPWTVPEMNYRAFNLLTGLPNTTSVPEPETAGSIAWILYQAYNKTASPKYLQGAELALDFLENWTTNPSYEIQLPYGIATAARMNAVEGTNYDIEKMMNWTFSSGLNTLRGWGCIVGSWNGYDVSGLIGEANDDDDDYAFSMNGFQHAAALAPVAKYDKRYARAIGKWLLNLANSSRLFYSNALPEANQESASYAWAAQYDTNFCIPYEAMKQTWNGTQPVAMGDAVEGGWAATDLSMYSGSAVGYLAAIIDSTNVNGILQIDLNKTDFRGENNYPNYLYYNSTTNSQIVNLTLSSGNYDVYDAISETVLQSNVSGTINFNIDADSVKLLVIYAADQTTELNGRLKTVDGHIIDFHANNDYSNSLRIKAFSVSDTLVQTSDSLTLYCLTENTVTSNPSFQWFQNDELLSTTTTDSFSWQAPVTAGDYLLKCKISENSDTVTSASIAVTVVDQIIISPVISDISFSTSMPFDINSTHNPVATINTTDVQYLWSVDDGTLTNPLTASPTWNLPASPGVYSISLTVTNSSDSSTYSKSVLLKDFSITAEPTPLIYYAFNEDTKNSAQDNYHAISVNAVSTTGANGIANAAYQFPSSASYIYTANESALNFQDQIAISFWVKPDALPSNEQFILSHGSWEDRYKLSITTDKTVRWTVKTNNAVIDVDADTLLQIDKFDHYTAIYTGYSSELYRNGELSAFKAQTGLIQTTANSLTIARKDEATSDYNFSGTVDEIRIYDTDLPQSIIQLLPTTFELQACMADSVISNFIVYPNPFTTGIQINLPTDENIAKIEIYNLIGKLVYQTTETNSYVQISIPNGFYLLRVIADSGKNFKTKLIKKD